MKIKMIDKDKFLEILGEATSISKLFNTLGYKSKTIHERTIARYNNFFSCDIRAKIAENKQEKLIYQRECKNCGDIFNKKPSKHASGDFCSLHCAKSFATKEKREEINAKVIAHFKKHPMRITEERLTVLKQQALEKHERCKKNYSKNAKRCECCGKKIEYINRYRKTCSEVCRRRLISLKTTPLTHHTHRGYYKGIWCDSSWELAFLVFHLENNIPIQRNITAYEYEYLGNKHLYYPDFIVNDTLIEIKGYVDEKAKAKEKSMLKNKYAYVIIDKNKIKVYIKYVVEKYGRDFHTLLYDSSVV